MPSFPRITVITPSFNQVAYIERTIRSVLDQNYPNLEYIVIDGGSTDGSLELIKRYASRLTYWVSEPDRGQVHAINKGMLRATGDWVAWQNSDDTYYPGTFDELAATASRYPHAGLIIGDLMLIDKDDAPIRDVRYITPLHNALIAEGMLVANQAAFWRREVHATVGFLDERYQCSFDYDWFLRITKEVRGVHASRIWGALRLHGDTKTSLQASRFREENDAILRGRKMPRWKKATYKLRRICLMLLRGQYDYVLRGMVRRMRGNLGTHH